MSGYLLHIQDWEKLAKKANFQPQVMAALCPISLRQLERFFKKDLRKTPRQWVRDLRCRLARDLISTGWSSKAVAAELHYWDESHFCREFKRVYRASPQTFAPGMRPRPAIDQEQAPFLKRQCNRFADSCALVPLERQPVC